LVSEARVLKLNMNGAGKKVESVEFIKQNQIHTVTPKKKVILAGGPFGTVSILEHSGIGNKTYLESVGISSTVDLPLVGSMILDRYFLRLIFLSNGTDCRPPKGSLTIYLNDTTSSLPYPKFEMSIRNDNFGITIPITLFMRKNIPQDYGNMHVKNSDTLRDPVVSYNLSQYGTTRNDVNPYIQVVQMLDNFTMAFSNVSKCTWNRIDPSVATLPMFSSAAAVKSWLLNQDSTPLSASSWHTIGGAVLGNDATNSVVDRYSMHVHGIDNLIVGDGSIAPAQPGCHTTALYEMIGTRAGEAAISNTK